MKSPASFFNMAIYRNNMRRFGFIGILFAIIHFIVVPLNMIIGNFGYSLNRYEDFTHVVPHPWDVLVLFFLPILLGIVLYRYIQEERALSVLHALPVTRRAYYGTNLVTFLTLYYGPILLNILIILAATAGWGLLTLEVAALFARYALMMLVAGMAVFGISTTFGMLVGSSVLQGILVYIMMIVPYGLYHLFNLLISWLLKGYPFNYLEDAVFYLSPYVAAMKFFDSDMTEYWIGIVTFAAYAVSMLWLGYWLYTRRELEKHHELLVWNKIKEAFVYILTTVVTLLIAVYLGEMGGEQSSGILMGVFIGSVIGFSITKMVAYKTINILKYYKGWLVYLALSMVVFLVFEMGLFGYETRMPDPGDIESLVISERGGSIDREMLERVEAEGVVDQGYNRVFKLESGEAVSKARNLHGYFAKNEEDYAGDTAIGTQLNFYYNLTGGGHLYRVYYGSVPFRLVKELYETEEVRKDKVVAAAEILLSKEVYSVKLSSHSQRSVDVDEQELASLFDAYARDLMTMPYDEIMMNSMLGGIEVTLDKAGVASQTLKDYRNFEIYFGSKNTIAWVMEHYPDLLLMPSAEDVREMSVYDVYSRMPSTEKPFAVDYAVEEYYDNKGGNIITDKALIQAALDLETVYGQQRYNVVFYLENGGSLSRSYATLPEIML